MDAGRTRICNSRAAGLITGEGRKRNGKGEKILLVKGGGRGGLIGEGKKRFLWGGGAKRILKIRNYVPETRGSKSPSSNTDTP